MVSKDLAAAVLGSHVGHASVTAALHPQFLRATHLAFVISAGLCEDGVVASLTRGNVHGVIRTEEARSR